MALEAAMHDATNWAQMRRLALRGRYLFCSTEKLDDASGEWMQRFCHEAWEHRARVVVEMGYVYVLFRLESESQL